MSVSGEVSSQHPMVAAAAQGVLPSWARMTPGRRDHARRVATLLDAWAGELGLEGDERARWVAAGWLHDALKDEEPDALRAWVGSELDDFPKPVLHGPAVAARLRAEGVEDGGLLGAVAWHTLGHPDLQPVGMALYCADFLEPGRDLRNRWRAKLRARMPEELGRVTRSIVRARIEHLLKRKRPVRPETLGFWNRLARGRPWASASEL